jgi:hypothetical protein
MGCAYGWCWYKGDEKWGFEPAAAPDSNKALMDEDLPDEERGLLSEDPREMESPLRPPVPPAVSTLE